AKRRFRGLFDPVFTAPLLLRLHPRPTSQGSSKMRSQLAPQTLVRLCPASFVLTALYLSFVASTGQAGQFNSILNIGDPAPAWKDLPGVDGKRHSLADLQNRQIVVVVFTCNSCPIASDYEDRIIAFAKKYCGPGKNAGLVAINVNTVEEDSLPH